MNCRAPHGSGTRTRMRLALLLMAFVAAPACAQDPLELRVTSAFLFNFAKFVSWPAATVGPSDPIRICLFVHDAIGPFLAAAIEGKSVEGHLLLLHKIDRPARVHDCEIAYLGTIDAGWLPATLGAFAGTGVLTVFHGDAPQHDGVVRLFIDERKLHIEINQAAAERARLELSSRLLNIVSVVRD